MGSYLEIHAGPYMLVSKIPTKTEVVKQTCVDSDCILFDTEIKFPFCPQCGGKSEHKTHETETYKDVRDIMYKDEFEGQMVAVHNGGAEFSQLFSVLLPNHYIKGLEEPGIDMDEVNIVEIKPERMEREIKWFMSEYTELIAAIVAEFGESAVQIKWGIIKHYN